MIKKVFYQKGVLFPEKFIFVNNLNLLVSRQPDIKVENGVWFDDRLLLYHPRKLVYWRGRDEVFLRMKQHLVISGSFLVY